MPVARSDRRILDTSKTLRYSGRRRAGARHVTLMALRSFAWWFAVGSLLTLSVLMVQGGLRDLWEGTHPAGGMNTVVYFGTTMIGGGLLAGCVALVLNRLR